jgi:hypothetical protein
MVGLIAAGIAAVSAIVNGIYQHDQDIKKQQALDRQNDQRRKLFQQGKAQLDQSRARKQGLLKDWMSSARSDLQGAFGDIRDEARGATGRLGTLGGTPEQKLVEPQISRLTSQFNTLAQDRFLGIESDYEQGLLGLGQQYNQSVDVSSFADDTFGAMFEGGAAGFNLGSDIENWYDKNYGAGSAPGADKTGKKG